MKMKKFLLRAVVLAAAILAVYTGTAAQTQVVIVGSNVSPKASQVFNVAIRPGHFYQLVFAPTPSISSSWVPLSADTNLQYSVDSPGTPGQTFNNYPVTAFVMGIQASETGAMQPGNIGCTGIPSLGASEGMVCNLFPLPAQTLKITTNGNGTLTGSYEILLFDLTALGVNQPASLQSPFATQGVPTSSGVQLLGNASGSSNGLFPIGTDSGAAPVGLLASLLQAGAKAETSFTGQNGFRDSSGSYNLTAAVMPALSKDGTAVAGFLRSVSIFKDVTATATGNTALWTPTTGKKFRILCVGLDVTADVKAAAATDLAISFQDSSTAIPGFSWSFFVPTAAGTVAANGTIPTVCFANGFLSSTVNNVLNVNLSAALTGGLVHVRVYGDEE